MAIHLERELVRTKVIDATAGPIRHVHIDEDQGDTFPLEARSDEIPFGSGLAGR